MRAVTFEAAGQPLMVRSVPDPVPTADEVVIQVAHCGICGSDLHMSGAGWLAPGQILGHEFAGTIAAVGSGVRGAWKIGQRTTALPLHSCEHCESCEEGYLSLCAQNGFYGVARPGAYAEYIAVRASMLQPLPDGVSFELGALVEPLAVGHHAVSLSGSTVGADVLVLGAGPIGAGVAMFARLAGARHVVVSDFAPGRRQRARELGATHVIDPATENPGERFAAIAGHAPDVVYECAGRPGLVQQALDLIRPRGQVIVAGVCFEDDMFKPTTGFMKEARISFSQCYTPTDFEKVIDAIAKGEADPKPMLTDVIGLDAVPERFEELRRPSDQCKVLIDPAR